MGDYKLYAEDESYKLYQGKMQDVIDNCLEENSIDCIITDPPYGLTSITDRFGKEGSAPCQEGTDGAFKRLSKGFLGQTWDGTGVEYDVETWKRCLKVLKPGGYLLAFTGSRTYHKIACAIEDAGFEIRDEILYLYGSAMPKATDIGLMIDKRNGVKPKIVGYEQGSMPDFRDVGKKQKALGGEDKLTFGQIKNSERKEQPIYQAQNEWAGWKSSLKPMHESIIVARKNCEELYYEDEIIFYIYQILKEGVINKCQKINTNANFVEKNSMLKRTMEKIENFVAINAALKVDIRVNLSEVMDMLRLELETNSNLNTELLCLNFLEEIYYQMNKFTTKMKINLITELKILNLLVVQNISKNIIQKEEMNQLGVKQNVLTVEEFLKEERAKLDYILILSAQENATLKENEKILHPNLEKVVMARKPFKGSLTDNVLENGVGALNIEECRIGDEVINVHNAPKGTFAGGERDRGSDTNSYREHSGRYPGNVIHDGSEEATQFMPNTKGSDTDELGKFGYTFGKERDSKPMAHGYNDEGSAARYFYTAKASSKDRDEGLDEFEKINIYKDGDANWGYSNTQDDNFGDRIANVKRANIHPT